MKKRYQKHKQEAAARFQAWTAKEDAAVELSRTVITSPLVTELEVVFPSFPDNGI